MSSKWRRYEVLLPLRFNDGREVPAEWLAEAVFQIVDRFGAASYETQKVEGHWRQGGLLYRDDLARIVVDVPDIPDHRSFMLDFKTRWKARLDQLELWLVSYEIEITLQLNRPPLGRTQTLRNGRFAPPALPAPAFGVHRHDPSRPRRRPKPTA